MLRTESPDGLDPLLEIVARDERVPLDLRPVVVDRAHGVTQQRGDFRRVVDAQPDQREDAQLGRQQLALFRLDARLLVLGKTILEALNTDLVCDAINTAMRELFLQIVYGRTQSAFSEGGLMIGAGLEDLGKGLRSQVGTLYGTLAKGSRYLEMAEGYIKTIALDKNDEICGYEFVHLGKFMDEIKKGTDANEALKKVTGTYGRFTEEQGAVKHIDPRHE